MTHTSKHEHSTDYELTPEGSFVIREYAQKKPFSNFLPGIAGLYGTPMWVFYVNRGQAVASFGTRNKDNAILEFFPANKAYQMVTSVGFRTFVKMKPAGASDEKLSFAELFREGLDSSRTHHRSMEVSSHELVIREKCLHSGLETEIVYFTIPNEPIAALARVVTVTNASREAADLEIMDGLPQVNPYGMNEFFMKQMSRTIEAWMVAENLSKHAPYFKLKVDATDRPEVTEIEGGNFFAAFEEEGRRVESLECQVDPAVLFGPALDYAEPVHFFKKGPYKVPFKAIPENKTPCAFAHLKMRLAPGRSKRWVVYSGHARSVDELNRYLLRARKPGYIQEKRQENRRLIQALKAPVSTVSSNAVYDAYCGQTFLDNILRGGTPVCIGKGDETLAYYVYSRKHGDLERDYNRFLVEDTYFSQGDGNYRDVNQNRRHDVWFEPKIGAANIRTFLNLIQLDGFNPLVVKGCLLHWKKNSESRKLLSRSFGPKNAADVEAFLGKPFKLGELYRFLETRKWMQASRFDRWVHEIAPFLSLEEKADHGEGFWVDHWTYNLDLVESYLAIYPERLRELFLEDDSYVFYDNSHRVRPRDEKFVLLERKGVRQYQSVVDDKEKAAKIRKRSEKAHWVRTRRGEGEIYQTVLLVKLLTLFTNKIASLDAEGIGIEMEADKPSWYDALNGLPGLAGSSLCESFELKRLAVFLIQVLDDLLKDGDGLVRIPEELADLIQKLEPILERTTQRKIKAQEFWDDAATAKEKYRQATIFGVSGKERHWTLTRLRRYLEHSREKIDLGLEKAFDPKTGLVPTYLQNEVIQYEKLGRTADGQAQRVRPIAFRSSPLPYFLEGVVHALKVEKDPARRKAMYQAVRRSALYDAKLGMYKVNAPMASASMEIGRARVFTPGWLENESIWLHMEYKYLLEVLRSGMNEEFFQDAKKALIPFQDPARYGRSPLENSSFIVSGVFPDAALHGAGFVARLSGSTAEFIQLWFMMNVGKRPFVLGPDGKVSLRFEPHLAASFFTPRETVRTFVDRNGQEQALKVPKNSFAFLFLGKTWVVYSNPKGLDTFGKTRVSVRRILLKDARGQVHEFKGDTVPAPWAARVRDERIPRIDIELG